MNAHTHAWRLAFRRSGVRLDVCFGLALAIILTCVVAWELHNLLTGPSGPQSDARSFVSAIVAGWSAIVLACIGGAIKITSTRQSLVTLFTSEIRAIQYGLRRMEMFGFWVWISVHVKEGHAGFADVPREENYFALFHSVIGNVANLHPRVVEAIVRYYTYLKMSRDAAGALKSWEKVTNPELRKLHVACVVQLLSLSCLWGFVALWYMGQMATKPDRDLADRMEDAVESLLGVGTYAQMKELHPERAALVEFFNSPPPQSSSDGARSATSGSTAGRSTGVLQ